MHRVRVSRRGLLVGGGGLLAAGAVGGGSAYERARRAEIPLYSETVAFSAPDQRVLVPAGRAGMLVPGSRVLGDSPFRERLVDDENTWLARCAGWARDPDTALRSALLDLRALSVGLPVAVAGWSPRWRYAWPRDVAFVAAALGRLGRTEDALSQLRFLQLVQGADGWFEARYDPRTMRSPDDRVAQLDGAGWVLWAAEQLVRHTDEDPEDLLSSLRPVLVRSTDLLLGSIDPSTGLPPPSSDYWELVETSTTLGTSAAVLAGLRSAVRVLPSVHAPEIADRAEAAAERLRAAVTTSYGPNGYPRIVGGDSPDASVTFLVAPIGRPDPDLALIAAMNRAQSAMRRPAGGLAPGASWKKDGISWTPETALFAAAWAANGFPEKAQHLLDWLGRHRTAAGSFPEKVLYDGRPAAVAPLAWTAASVVIARHELAGAP